jgi:outer membrane lipoprotein-sorting protein
LGGAFVGPPLHPYPTNFLGRTVKSRSLFALILVSFGALCSPSALVSQPQGSAEAALGTVLKQMEALGKTFQSFQAQFSQKKYTSVLKEFDTPDSGEFYYARAKDGSALLRQETMKPGKRVLTIKGGQAVIYQPTMNQAQIVNLGKNKDKAEYLALGLGQSPGKLKETFEISYAGSEKIAGADSSIIVLKPRNAAAAAYFSSITLWIKKLNGVPIQQKLQEPNGDYLLVSFSQEKLNPAIPPSRFEQKLPPNAEILRLQ